MGSCGASSSGSCPHVSTFRVRYCRSGSRCKRSMSPCDAAPGPYPSLLSSYAWSRCNCSRCKLRGYTVGTTPPVQFNSVRHLQSSSRKSALAQLTGSHMDPLSSRHVRGHSCKKPVRSVGLVLMSSMTSVMNGAQLKVSLESRGTQLTRRAGCVRMIACTACPNLLLTLDTCSTRSSTTPQCRGPEPGQHQSSAYPDKMLEVHVVQQSVGPRPALYV